MFSNPQILQMVFALEWFNIKKTSYSDLIEFHPELTIGDYNRLSHLNFEHTATSGVTLLLTTVIANRHLANQAEKFRLMKQRWLRMPCALACGGVLTFAINALVMQPMYRNDIKDMGMERYFESDLDKNLMRKDLADIGIEVEDFSQ